MARAHRRVLRVVVEFDVLARAFRPVLDHQLQRIQHRHAARGDGVQVIADLEFQQRDIGHAIELGDADALAEVPNRRCRIAASADAGKRGHARVVPTAHQVFLHQLEQLALAHHGVAEVQPRELDLPRPGGHRAVLDHPVVEGPVDLELQRAQRVGDVLLRVLQRVGEVVHRVEAPRVAGVVVVGVHDPVDHRVAHDDVRRGHVDLRPQHRLALLELPAAHPGEEVQAFLHRPIAPWRRRAGDVQVAAAFLDLLRRLLVDVGETLADEMHGAVVVELEVVAGEEHVVAPVEAEPLHVGLDAFDVFGLLLRRIRVVEAQVAARAGGSVLLRDPEVQADRLRVAEVQVAVRLRRKARDGRRVFAGGEVRGDDLADEVEFGRVHGKVVGS